MRRWRASPTGACAASPTGACGTTRRAGGCTCGCRRGGRRGRGCASPRARRRCASRRRTWSCRAWRWPLPMRRAWRSSALRGCGWCGTESRARAMGWLCTAARRRPPTPTWLPTIRLRSGASCGGRGRRSRAAPRSARACAWRAQPRGRSCGATPSAAFSTASTSAPLTTRVIGRWGASPRLPATASMTRRTTGWSPRARASASPFWTIRSRACARGCPSRPSPSGPSLSCARSLPATPSPPSRSTMVRRGGCTSTTQRPSPGGPSSPPRRTPPPARSPRRARLGASSPKTTSSCPTGTAWR
ncbi:hypothetical protein BU14_0121s0025 [Porphyra umbilicalis]|uniref:Uncharacterized protein n=1 Tax=Porphyra umbilicalis TaxID=2786 RepID=A0A1X6PB89_PORUM|nr:hypothetical protein BU14_0121s0025 [Porphyra umbilicalis]|eukprot:OSX78097.1 hypothetical protein BU14_0121s0025 [Porphyra umbilicalis]